MPKNSTNILDTIIIGGGPAGCNAAVVLARCHRSVLIIDEGKQRNLRSRGMHNFLTRDGILPKDFLKEAYKELRHFKVTIRKDRAVEIKKLKDHFLVKTEAGSEHRCRRLLLATGVSDCIPAIPGMEELWGSHVFHCQFCDGFEHSNKAIGLYSRRINGFGMALALMPFSKNITLFTDGNHNLRAAQRAELKKHGIKINTRCVTKLIHRQKKLSGVGLINGEVIACDILYVNNGYQVNNYLFVAMGGRTTAKGAAVTNRHQECNIRGLYVAGDAALDAHFVIIAAAQGARAGIAIHEDLLREDNAKALSV